MRSGGSGSGGEIEGNLLRRGSLNLRQDSANTRAEQSGFRRLFEKVTEFHVLAERDDGNRSVENLVHEFLYTFIGSIGEHGPRHALEFGLQSSVTQGFRTSSGDELPHRHRLGGFTEGRTLRASAEDLCQNGGLESIQKGGDLCGATTENFGDFLRREIRSFLLRGNGDGVSEFGLVTLSRSPSVNGHSAHGGL